MITFNQIIDNKEYRERVIKFFRLPIRLSVSKDKFLSDLEFIKSTDSDWYNTIVHYTENDFNKLAKEQGTSEPDFTMENILEPLLNKLENTVEWQEFIKKDYSSTLKDYDGITNTHGFYKKENHDKHFISIDLKSANWQSLQNIIGFYDSYENLIKDYTDNLIPPISKSFRTKITGVLGAKAIMDYNKHLLNVNKDSILESIFVHSGISLMNKIPFAFYADEFLIEIDGDLLNKFNSLDLESLESSVYRETGVQVHITPFTLKWLNVNKGCAKVYKDSFEFLNLSKDIVLIINKLIHDYPINEVDFEGVKLKNESKEDFINKLSKIADEYK